jgi:transposase
MSVILSLIAVGVDIAKAHFDVARLANGKYRHKKFDNTPRRLCLVRRVAGAGCGGESPHICLEATGTDSVPLAEYLAGHGFLVSVVNPAKVAHFAKNELSRAKTDKADAKLIARFCLAARPAPWTPPPPEIHGLQILLRRAEQLRKMERTGKTAWTPPAPPSQARCGPCSPPWKRRSRTRRKKSADTSTATPA